MNTSGQIPQNSNYIEIWQSLGEFFSFWKGSGCLVKLVAAKVIRQDMFFFTLSYFVHINLWNKCLWYKKYGRFTTWKSW